MIVETVGELRKALEHYPGNMKLLVSGPDSGGYDSAWCLRATVEPTHQWTQEEQDWFKTHRPEVMGRLVIEGKCKP